MNSLRELSHTSQTPPAFFQWLTGVAPKRRPFGSVNETLMKDADLTSTEVDTKSDSAGTETRSDPFPSTVLGFRCIIGLMSLAGEHKAGFPPLLWGSARLRHPPLGPSGTSLCAAGTPGRGNWLQVLGMMRHPSPHGGENAPRGRERQKGERESLAQAARIPSLTGLSFLRADVQPQSQRETLQSKASPGCLSLQSLTVS